MKRKGKNSTESSVGIGLAISKNIIEKDGGNIKCSSEKNNGAIFEIKYLFSWQDVNNMIIWYKKLDSQRRKNGKVF